LNSRIVLSVGLGLTSTLFAAPQPPLPPEASAPGRTTLLDPVIVTGQLDQSRQSILPNLGATSYRIDAEDIQNQSQGDNAPFNQVLLRAPGVAQDSAANGDLHVRGEHANLQYRINDVLLPEGITGFGLELDSRFVDNVQLITGSLPAQYGFRTAGIVDIQTKSGAFDRGGDASIYAGAHDTVRPSLEYAGATGRLSYFVDASLDHNDLGIENPTPQATALHDRTEQSKAFAYASYLLDATSRLSFIGSASSSNFQVPDTAGLPAGTAPDGQPWLPGSFNSAQLNEHQNEQNDYAVAAYQKSADNLNYQLSGFARASRVHFTPDPVGDLYFNGVASDVDRKLSSLGFQGDGSYALTDAHTLRAGVFILRESVSADSTTTVFTVNAGGDPMGSAFAILEDHRLSGLFAGLYLQDEWHALPHFTVNYGARFDAFDSSFDDEHQVSPRLNLVYEPSPATTLHAGYARYFTPPPVENVSGASVAKFDGTSNASATDRDDPVRAERSNYFDAGLTQKLGSDWQVGLDGYYQRAQNQLDDGLFGQTLILSAFNYAQGEIYGAEFTAAYTHGGFSAYANLARSEARGRTWSSAQFLFNPADLAYVQDHWIHLDHDQRLSGSFGVARRWTERRGSTRIYADALYGTGLRTDATAADGANIPNGGSVPAYATLNLGAEQSFTLAPHRAWKVRVDLINVTDHAYELRDGSGVGVNAAQYGMRFGAFGSVSYPF
jgi:outer membrane receptor protein involved in Fe transport